MEEKSNKKEWFLPVLLATSVCGLWAASWCLIVSCPILEGWPQRGTFGDMFGAVNALFSGLAFAGVIYAIFLQRKELILQREELQLTRKELEGQKQELEIQNKTSSLQRFENTFFQLLNLLESVIDDINISRARFGGSVSSQEGKRSFGIILEHLKRKRAELSKDLDDYKNPDTIINAYKGLYSEIHVFYGHFIDIFIHLLNYVYINNVEFKQLYYDLIRAQLNEPATIFVFYHIASQIDGLRMQDIVDDAHFFKDIDISQLHVVEDFKLFSPTAYGTE
ncbi:MAG: hypothetical protein CVU61_02060 [Deltaproteobacteria bacterium HGW-Deltaproteobacteria-19]|nr:MAG: hypothetical protein CVU61_02060 [Deltaproteobacteria bacterium HGW-Deltaproteobacteria-19]